MARYRKIDVRTWNDAKFVSLSDRGKLVFLFLLTHPNMTMLGAMRATIPGLAAELGMDFEGFLEAFQEASAKGMVKHDARASFVWLPNFMKYNKPESPNVVRAWPDAWELLPECQLKGALGQQLKGFAEGLTLAFREAFAEAFRKTMPNQEQEQEQKQENTFAQPAVAREQNHPSLRKGSGKPSESNPSDAEAGDCDGDSEPIDPRHGPIRALIQQLHLEKFKVKSQWDGSEARALDRLLAANRSWTEEQIAGMVRNRFASDGIAGRPRKWIAGLDDYAGGPLDRYGRTKGEGKNGNNGTANRAELRQASNLAARASARAAILAS